MAKTTKIIPVIIISFYLVFAQLWIGGFSLELEDSSVVFRPFANTSTNMNSSDGYSKMLPPTSIVRAGGFRKMLQIYCIPCPQSGCLDSDFCRVQCCPRCAQCPYTAACGGVYNCDECCAVNFPE
ncbi:OLC1v1035658C1 [Oldenlandia corymbosa var. corymbosa]|uniref:OLC1v1035658C1 n=1 Tax=Oldenlandia corymbosa var. corymbosa TaxID=529605 RepID=A0AAV1CVD5_OLDCO|nr:OLC1v1035658C1 [Oldenlandia corymbosa var. corymbosa]